MTQAKPFLPYGRHWVDDADVAAVEAVLRGETLTGGPAVAAFESKLTEVTGAEHAVSCSSGTAALHMAMMAAGIGSGDTVIVPTVTFLASANAARYVGADVVFADVDADSGLMGPQHFQAALESANGNVKAVVPVHLSGQICDMPAIRAIAREHKILVIEDACHALGTTSGNNNLPSGSCAYSDMATFSFHPVKTVAMGEGGAITTNDVELAQKLRLVRNHGMTRDKAAFVNDDMAFDDDGNSNPWYYEMSEPGFNYRASDIHCALGLSQLDKLFEAGRRRRQLAGIYDTALANISPHIRPLARVAGCDPVWHLYVVLIEFEAAGTDRATLMRCLHERGIGTQVHYIPVHEQPYYRDLYGRQTLPGADTYYRRCLTLPLFPAMDDSEVERVVGELSNLLKDG
ncbi:MAG: UDP-4-amino-4,6-dideoxy-N-acetyl-beta-L-altrosamine transaminase [Rhodospirillales bacterium]|nr:UDP-4-amino-4,6-dideoxy-N-acetyl-beta-L-altrosamine transaminase [Rhodospirillales bacterium]